MKKIFFAFVLSLIAFSILNAHPASDVKAVFETETSLLRIDYTHKVSDGSSHFIFDVEVSLNGKKAVKQELWKQETNNGGSLIYKIIDAKPGDKITVFTECNKGGKKSQTVEVK